MPCTRSLIETKRFWKESRPSESVKKANRGEARCGIVNGRRRWEGTWYLDDKKPKEEMSGIPTGQPNELEFQYKD